MIDYQEEKPKNMKPDYFAANLTQARCEEGRQLVYKPHLRFDKNTVKQKRDIIFSGAG